MMSFYEVQREATRLHNRGWNSSDYMRLRAEHPNLSHMDAQRICDEMGILEQGAWWTDTQDAFASSGPYGPW